MSAASVHLEQGLYAAVLDGRFVDVTASFQLSLLKVKPSVTRQKFLEDHADRDKIVMTAHFPLPSVGRVISAGDAFRFEYLKK